MLASCRAFIETILETQIRRYPLANALQDLVYATFAEALASWSCYLDEDIYVLGEAMD